MSYPFTGYDIGVLVMTSWVPKPMGHISQAGNYDFPIYYYTVESTNTTNIHGGDKSILPDLIAAAKHLEEMGCKCITSSCGYFAHFQKEVAEAVSIPVCLSTITLIPFLLSLLKSEEKLALICYNKSKLTANLFKACNVTDYMLEKCVIRDVINEKEFSNIIKDQGHYNITNARNELIKIAENTVKDYRIGAFLLECTDMPPCSFYIQKKLNLPVFDATLMVKFLQRIYGRIENED